MKKEFRLYRKADRDRDDDAIRGGTAYPAGTGGGIGGSSRGSGELGGTPEAGCGCAAEDTQWEGYVGYHVVDKNEEVVGKVSALWTDDSGQLAFLGVRTGWFGKHHVFPAEAADVDSTRQRIRVPFAFDAIREAPTFAADEELSDGDQETIRNYFAAFGYQGRESTGYTPSESPSANEPAMNRSSEEASVKLSEEEVRVGKREVEAGGVRLRKIVRTETVNQPVELKREELIVERVPGSEATGQPQQAFQEQEVYVPLRREEAVVEKQTRVREEVRVRKDARTETQNVTEQIRKEDVEIQSEGQAREVEKPRRS